MSQVSIIDIEGNHPTIPTSFDTDDGTAIPIGNVLEILGETQPNGTFTQPVWTTGSGNTVTANVQLSAAVAATPVDFNDAGIASFNSAHFSVDANGFVSLVGGGGAIDSIAVDATSGTGTNPVVPDGAGLITVTGSQIATGTIGANVIRTISESVNAYTVQIQQASSAAAEDTSINGVAHFNSAQFTVSNGFVSLAGGGLAIDSIGVQANTAPGTDPVVPTAAGLVTVNGAAVAAHGVPLESHSRAANEYNLEVQYASAQASTDATDSGICHFDSSEFDVDANGFVTLDGAGAIQTLTPDEDADGSAATPISPQSGNINILGSNPSGATVTETYNSTGASTGNMLVEHRAWTTKLVVDTSTTPGTRGTFSTLAAAIAAASAGDTVFLRTSVTENVTLPPNVNIAGWSGSSASVPSITGLVTMTGAGTSSLSGLSLVDNGAGIIAVTGSAASVLSIVDCYLSNGNVPAITYSSSSSSSSITVKDCRGDLTDGTASWFTHTSAGNLVFRYCNFGNNGGSTTASTASAGYLEIMWCRFNNPITTSGTNRFFCEGLRQSQIVNVTGLTIGGSDNQDVSFANINNGNASTVSVSSSLNIMNSVINSTNTNPITGAGTVNYGDITMQGSGSAIDTTTQVAMVTRPGITRSDKQPGFSAYASLASNVTGDGTNYTIISNNEIFDALSEYDNTTGIYTATYTGRYQFNYYSFMGASSNITAAIARLNTSNLVYRGNAEISNALTSSIQANSDYVDLDAADTCFFSIETTDSGGKDNSVLGTTSGQARTRFSGWMVC